MYIILVFLNIDKCCPYRELVIVGVLVDVFNVSFDGAIDADCVGTILFDVDVTVSLLVLIKEL